MSDYIFAIDPGCAESAYCVIDRDTLRPEDFGKVPNEELLCLLGKPNCGGPAFVIEMVASYGMAVGKEVFETVFWIGRFYEAAWSANKARIYRMQVKQHICHDSRAKDSNIRQALIDRFGGVGVKKAPGWFYGFKADIWSAYAVGLTYAETCRE